MHQRPLEGPLVELLLNILADFVGWSDSVPCATRSDHHLADPNREFGG
jgi:hypothetical protein